MWELMKVSHGIQGEQQGLHGQQGLQGQQERPIETSATPGGAKGDAKGGCYGAFERWRETSTKEKFDEKLGEGGRLQGSIDAASGRLHGEQLATRLSGEWMTWKSDGTFDGKVCFRDFDVYEPGSGSPFVWFIEIGLGGSLVYEHYDGKTLAWLHGDTMTWDDGYVYQRVCDAGDGTQSMVVPPREEQQEQELAEVSGVTITEIIAGADVKEKGGIRMLGGIGILEDVGRPPGRLFGD